MPNVQKSIIHYPLPSFVPPKSWFGVCKRNLSSAVLPCAGGLVKAQPRIHRVGRLFVVVQKQESVVEVLLVQGNTFLAKDLKNHSEMVKDVGQRDAIGKFDAVRNSETVRPDSELR